MTLNDKKLLLLTLKMEEKLQLSKLDVRHYWAKHDSKMAKIIHLMENMETWVVDDVESVSKELVGLGKSMMDAQRHILGRNTEELIIIMAYISCGKALRIMNWIDENHAPLSLHSIMEARQSEDFEEGKLMIDRLKTLKSVNLLSKVFSPDRMRMIIQLLKEDD